jgi:hypothetical protein
MLVPIAVSVLRLRSRAQLNDSGGCSGTPFRVNRAYAETLGDAWVILSAKYGYLWPTDLIPGPYEVTFKRAATQPVQIKILRAQVEQLELSTYEQVIGLGGKEYRQAIEQSFGPQTHLSFPFAGLPLGYALQATNAARQAEETQGRTCGWPKPLNQPLDGRLSASSPSPETTPK